MSFSTQKGTSKKSGLCRLQASADMSIYGAADNHRSLQALLAEFTRFEVDLSPVDEIDTSGVQLLLATAREARQAEKPFLLHSPSAPVEEVLQLLDIRGHFDWLDREP